MANLLERQFGLISRLTVRLDGFMARREAEVVSSVLRVPNNDAMKSPRRALGCGMKPIGALRSGGELPLAPSSPHHLRGDLVRRPLLHLSTVRLSRRECGQAGGHRPPRGDGAAAVIEASAGRPWCSPPSLACGCGRAASPAISRAGGSMSSSPRWSVCSPITSIAARFARISPPAAVSLTSRQCRLVNEVPTLILLTVVIMAVVKPF